MKPARHGGDASVVHVPLRIREAEKYFYKEKRHKHETDQMFCRKFKIIHQPRRLSGFKEASICKRKRYGNVLNPSTLSCQCLREYRGWVVLLFCVIVM